MALGESVGYWQGDIVIKIENLSISRGCNGIIKNLNLEIPRGEFVLLTGPSGCGKTTLAYAVCGLIPHSVPARMQGQVTVAGMDTRSYPLPELAQYASLVFQNPSTQLFHLKVYDEVAFGPRNLGFSKDDVRDRVEWALHACGLYALRNEKTFHLSGGQKQTLAIATVLALRPDILVLDEPTASLDIPNSRRVMESLRTLHQKQDMTILIIEHRFADFIQEAERALVMDWGQIVADGPPRQVLNDRDIRQTLGLRRPNEKPSDSWHKMIRSNGHRRTNSAPLLALENVSAGHHRKVVVHNINLELYPGDFTALVGNNGAGKTTLARVAAGLLKPVQGHVRFRGDKRPQPGLDICLLFQNPAEQLFTNQVEDEVSFGPRNYGIFDKSALKDVLVKADLVDLRTRRPLTLSVGQQQRTVMAACMALSPRLLILDEPTLGQDWCHLQQLMDFLVKLNQEGTAILLISHDFKLVHRYAKRLLLMEAGRITKRGKLPVFTKQVNSKEDPNEILNS